MLPIPAPGEGARRPDRQGRQHDCGDGDHYKDVATSHEFSCALESSAHMTAELAVTKVQIVCPGPRAATPSYAPWACHPATMLSLLARLPTSRGYPPGQRA